MNPKIVLNGNSLVEVRQPGWLRNTLATTATVQITLRQYILLVNTVYAELLALLVSIRSMRAMPWVFALSYVYLYHSCQGVTPIEQCTTFAALAAGGVRRDAVQLRIEDRQWQRYLRAQGQLVQAIDLLLLLLLPMF